MAGSVVDQGDRQIQVYSFTLAPTGASIDPVELLAPDEVARMNRFRFDRDKTRYATGRAMLRQLAATHLSCEPADLMIGTGTEGKPYVIGSDLELNLSHSYDVAVLAVSTAGPVGIDVELPHDTVDPDLLARSVFNPSELDALAQLSIEPRHARFYEFWTAKESYMKWVGCGMSLAPIAIHLDLVDGRPVGAWSAQYGFRPVRQLNPFPFAGACTLCGPSAATLADIPVHSIPRQLTTCVFDESIL